MFPEFGVPHSSFSRCLRFREEGPKLGRGAARWILVARTRRDSKIRSKLAPAWQRQLGHQLANLAHEISGMSTEEVLKHYAAIEAEYLSKKGPEQIDPWTGERVPWKEPLDPYLVKLEIAYSLFFRLSGRCSASDLRPVFGRMARIGFPAMEVKALYVIRLARVYLKENDALAAKRLLTSRVKAVRRREKENPELSDAVLGEIKKLLLEARQRLSATGK